MRIGDDDASTARGNARVRTDDDVASTARGNVQDRTLGPWNEGALNTIILDSAPHAKCARPTPPSRATRAARRARRALGSIATLRSGASCEGIPEGEGRVHWGKSVTACCLEFPSRVDPSPPPQKKLGRTQPSRARARASDRRGNGPTPRAEAAVEPRRGGGDARSRAGSARGATTSTTRSSAVAATTTTARPSASCTCRRPARRSPRSVV